LRQYDRISKLDAIIWMCSTENVMLDIHSQVRTLESLAGDLAKAASIREKVELGARIFGALAECEKLVERFMISEMATDSSDDNARDKREARADESHYREPNARQFRDMKLSDIGSVLLRERSELHGKEIERLAKAGGFKSTGKSFQGYLAVAFRRAGGFRNIGKNRWRLDPTVPPERERAGESDSSITVTGHAASNGVNSPSQKMRLHAWLKQNGPATRAEILKGSGVPEGTASSYLSVEKDLFESRDGKWYAVN
jgi:hypothetical protein